MLNSQQVPRQRTDKVCCLHLSQRAPLFTSPNCHRPQGSLWGHTQRDHSLASGSACVGKCARQLLPNSAAQFQRCFPGTMPTCPFRSPASPCRTCPSNSRSSTCASQLWRLPAACLGWVPITALPRHPLPKGSPRLLPV